MLGSFDWIFWFRVVGIVSKVSSFLVVYVIRFGVFLVRVGRIKGFGEVFWVFIYYIVIFLCVNLYRYVFIIFVFLREGEFY